VALNTININNLNWKLEPRLYMLTGRIKIYSYLKPLNHLATNFDEMFL
jgi:hypothetical protein